MSVITWLEWNKIEYQGTKKEDEIPFIAGQDAYSDGWNECIDHLISAWKDGTEQSKGVE